MEKFLKALPKFALTARMMEEISPRQTGGQGAEMNAHPELALDYLVAPPRMAHYIEWSTKIYNVYLKYVEPEDVFAYS